MNFSLAVQLSVACENKLQKAKGLVSYRMKRVNGRDLQVSVRCLRNSSNRIIPLFYTERKFVEVSVPVGHYTDFEAFPTCGIATTQKMIGHYDNPTYFLDPERVHAGILWFAKRVCRIQSTELFVQRSSRSRN